MLRTSSIPVVRVVAVDPGYRNLAFVVLEGHPITNKINLVGAQHIDVGPCWKQEDIIVKVWQPMSMMKPFADAEFVVIENQMIGRETKPNNQGIAWLLATMALNQSKHCSINLMNAKRKFSVFKEVKLPEKLVRGDRRRRNKFKKNSIYLAQVLLQNNGIDPGKVFKPGDQSTWDHLADAVNMAFVCFREQGFMIASSSSKEPHTPSSAGSEAKT